MATIIPKWQALEKKLTKNRMLFLWIGSLSACIIINIWMRALWAQAKFPTDVFTMQLSFSGEFLKEGYRFMLENGDLGAFRKWQIVDFAFMAAYGIFGISSALLVGHRFPPTSKNKIHSYYAATLMIIVPLLDVCENLTSLLTLSNPMDFPNILGVIHSLFALIKWTFGGVVLFWALGTLMILALKRRR